MSQGALKSSTVNTKRKRDEEVFKKAIKAYFGPAKDKCAVPKFDPIGHTSRTARYGKQRPTSINVCRE
jgi:hypothetical protein